MCSHRPGSVAQPRPFPATALSGRAQDPLSLRFLICKMGVGKPQSVAEVFNKMVPHGQQLSFRPPSPSPLFPWQRRPLRGTPFAAMSSWSRIPWSGLDPHKLWGWQKLWGPPQPVHCTAGETEAQSSRRAWLLLQLTGHGRGVHVLTAHLCPCRRLAQCV